MRLYLAGFWESNLCPKHIPTAALKDTFILSSYFYLRGAKRNSMFDPHASRSFMLDSGAFSFIDAMQNGKGNICSVNWRDYIREYAHYVVDKNIQNYIELDIDIVVGYKKVLDYRKELEDIVQRPCIPVYHDETRTLDDWHNDCIGHPYVALGNIAHLAVADTDIPHLQEAIDVGHEVGSKVHGLGKSNQRIIESLTFDSVDSATWVMDTVFGIHRFWDDATKRWIRIYVKQGCEFRPGWKERCFIFYQYLPYVRYLAKYQRGGWDEDRLLPEFEYDWPNVCHADEFGPYLLSLKKQMELMKPDKKLSYYQSGSIEVKVDDGDASESEEISHEEEVEESQAEGR